MSEQYDIISITTFDNTLSNLKKDINQNASNIVTLNNTLTNLVSIVNEIAKNVN